MPNDKNVGFSRALHGSGRQAEALVPFGTTFRPGRFGRMFPFLSPLVVSNAALDALAKAMIDDPETSSNNPRIPSGYTYLAQFVDHDLSFDPTPIPEQRIDPAALYNFRTARLDLDSLYGLGPRGQPFLYDQMLPNQFLLGGAAVANDLPRNSQGMALLGDPRNDENLIVAQLHLVFLKFHNAVVQHLGVNKPGVFDEARRLVTWHYQWIILNELLVRLLREGAVEEALNNSRQLLPFEWEGFIPVEFSMAAFRCGHTMVRTSYSLNRVQVGLGLRELFFGTGPIRKDSTGRDNLPLLRNQSIDWRLFFDTDTTDEELIGRKNLSRRLDPYIAPAMLDLMRQGRVIDAPTSIAARNLRRGVQAGLPSGQAIARALQLDVVSKEDLERGAEGAVLAEQGLSQETPLWYYILKEAQVVGSGYCLGPVGSTILAETFVALLRADPESYLVREPNWKPTLGTNGVFFMNDLLRFTERYLPVINVHERS